MMTAGRSLAPWVILIACGCGGGTAGGADPETPDTEDTESSESEAARGGEPAPDEAGAQDEPAGSGDSSESSSSATLDEGDLREVLQAVLSDPQLVDDLHLDKAGRKPLKVSGPSLPAKLNVIVASHEIKIVDAPASEKDPVLVITKLERDGNQARVHYRFDVEGLKGRATLYLKSGRWELGSNRVVEN